MIHGVREFGHALLVALGAPRSASVETFTEVRFKAPDGKTDIPGGAIVCERGRKRWKCLVEVKTGGPHARRGAGGPLPGRRRRAWHGRGAHDLLVS